MATKKGRGWHGDKAAHQKAGSVGGNATAENHGQVFYAKIGRSGGKISGGNFKNNLELAKKAGRQSVQKRLEAKGRNWSKGSHANNMTSRTLA